MLCGIRSERRAGCRDSHRTLAVAALRGPVLELAADSLLRVDTLKGRRLLPLPRIAAGAASPGKAAKARRSLYSLWDSLAAERTLDTAAYSTSAVGAALTMAAGVRLDLMAAV